MFYERTWILSRLNGNKKSLETAIKNLRTSEQKNFI